MWAFPKCKKQVLLLGEKKAKTKTQGCITEDAPRRGNMNAVTFATGAQSKQNMSDKGAWSLRAFPGRGSSMSTVRDLRQGMRHWRSYKYIR